MKICGSSLNSLNFHCAYNVYRRPPIDPGSLWYCYEDRISRQIFDTRSGQRTSKYRKKEYIRKYDTINGAKIAFKMPMNTNLLLNPSIKAARFRLFKNTFRTFPCSSNKYSIKQNLKFHSNACVNTLPFPCSSVTNRERTEGRGTRRSTSSLLNRAMR